MEKSRDKPVFLDGELKIKDNDFDLWICKKSTNTEIFRKFKALRESIL